MGYQATLGEHDPIEWLCFSSNLKKLFKIKVKKKKSKKIAKSKTNHLFAHTTFYH